MLFERHEHAIPEKKITWIKIDSLPEDKWVRDITKRRVVQTTPGEKVQKSDSTHLGWQNQRVERETVSKNKRIAMGSDLIKSSHLKQSRTNPSKTDHYKMNLSALGLLKLRSENTVDRDEPVWATPGTRPEDYLDGKQLSERTALNTREYTFYSYFQRIRERLDQAWIPLLRAKLTLYYKSGRHLASDMDHTTQVLVFLNKEGQVIRVQMVSESGNNDLDDAAVSAFNRAGPFPNPPKAMIDLNNEVKISWDFILKT